MTLSTVQNGAPPREAKAFRVVVDGRAVLYATPIILAEYEGVLLRPALRLDVPKVRGLLEAITAVAVVVDAVVRVDASPDEADNRFLECAETVGADFLVTGNRKHFPNFWHAVTCPLFPYN